jgi:hypothetical protein
LLVLCILCADYIDFLRVVTPNNAEEHMNQLRRFNMGQIGDVDCPVFDGVYEYCAVRKDKPKWSPQDIFLDGD